MKNSCEKRKKRPKLKNIFKVAYLLLSQKWKKSCNKDRKCLIKILKVFHRKKNEMISYKLS